MSTPFARARITIVLAAGVVIIGTAVLAAADVAAISVGVVFLILIVSGKLLRVYRYADVAGALGGVIGYGIVEQGQGQQGTEAWLASLLVFAAAVAAVRFIEKADHDVERQVKYSREMVEELTMYDQVSGLLKRQYGEIALEEEVQRARRTKTSLALVLMAADPTAEDGPLAEEDEEKVAVMGEMLRRTLRITDRLSRFSPTTYAAILPDTGAEGAAVVARKLLQAGDQHGMGVLRCAVASFPDHAVSSEQLLEEAEAGLGMARSGGLTVVTPIMLEQQRAG